MHEVRPIRSLSLFVGSGACNAACGHCAGVPHRKHAPKLDGLIDEELVKKTLRECHGRGARSLSVSSSGEPTLSPVAVTRALEIVHGLRKDGVSYNPINLYSNGIRIGDDPQFCGMYLPVWRDHGLTTIYVTVHDTDEARNAHVYGVKRYPPLATVIGRIHDAGLLMRANIVLNKNTVGTAERFAPMIERLHALGADRISAWPVRGLDDKVDPLLSPAEEELDRMEAIAMAAGYDVRVLREASHAAYAAGEKLTLFPDGTLSARWCS